MLNIHLHPFDAQMHAAMHDKCITDERFATDSPLVHMQKLVKYGDSVLFELRIEGFFPEASAFGSPALKGRLYLQLDDESGFYLYNFGMPGTSNVFVYKLKKRLRHRIVYALVAEQGIVAYGIRCI